MLVPMQGTIPVYYNEFQIHLTTWAEYYWLSKDKNIVNLTVAIYSILALFA